MRGTCGRDGRNASPLGPSVAGGVRRRPVIVPIRRLAVALFVILSACQRPPDSYAPPDQRPPAPALDPPGMMLAMDDPQAVRQIVRDVYEPLDSPWRRAGQQPAFKVRLATNANLKLSAYFTLWDEAFRQTGPL